MESFPLRANQAVRRHRARIDLDLGFAHWNPANALEACSGLGTLKFADRYSAYTPSSQHTEHARGEES